VLEVHAYIDVADLERGIAFYCEGLGLSLKRRLSPSWVELDGANLPVFLLGNRPPTATPGGTETKRSFARHWTPVHLDFVVADVDAAVQRALAGGATLDDPVASHTWGRIAHLADPFGNGFCLLQFLGRGYDEVASG
jgi:predicted enzyme related to lactoylglutathione lyase